MPDQPMYHRQVLDPLGLIAGMCDALSIGDVRDHATHQNPELRDLTVGEAVNAMVRNGLGFLTPALDLVPRFFHHQPTSRRISPGVVPAQRNDDARGRALDPLYDDGVMALDRLMAATAAERVGVAPRFTPRERTSFHVDGRDHSDGEPDAQVLHLTRG